MLILLYFYGHCEKKSNAMRIYLLLIGLLLTNVLFAFQNADAAYVTEINAWHTRREASLRSETGWLNLVGLLPLKEGKNTFGSDPSNDIIFPKGDANLGTLILKNGQVRMAIAPQADVRAQQKKVRKMVIFKSRSSESVVLSHQSLRWFIIRRGDRFFVRLRDLASPTVLNFKGIERFPVDPKWRVEATLEPAAPGFKLPVTDVIGDTYQEDSPGAFVFEIEGKQYRLYPTVEGDELFFVFGDATNGDTTYGAGRFFYADKADANGKTILDFNKAYNPPCAFTAFATCPLPNKLNILPIEVTAGEKSWGEH